MDCKTAQQKIMPYIHREMDVEELEEFIEHIRNCKTCSEELEVYFTIYYALEKLDQDEQGSYNIREMLLRDLEEAKAQVRKRNMLNFYKRFFIILLSVILVIGLITGVQAGLGGGFEATALYRMFSGESETERESRTEAEKNQNVKQIEETKEPETNRKFQVIITVPETEAVTEKLIDLTGSALTGPATEIDTAAERGANHE